MGPFSSPAPGHHFCRTNQKSCQPYIILTLISQVTNNYIKFFSNKMIVFDSSLVIMPDRPQVHVLVGLHQTWADFSWTLIVQGLTVFC